MNKKIPLLLLLALCALPLHAEEQKAEPKVEGQVAQEAQVASVAVVTATKGSLIRPFSTAVTVQAARRVTLGSQVAGPIGEIYVHPGDTVKKGQLLLKISHPALQGQIDATYSQVKAAQIQMLNAKDNLARQQRLLKAGYITPQALESAKVSYKAAAATYQGAQGSLKGVKANTEPYQITAPFAGKVLQDFNVTKGQIVAPGQPLFDLADLSSLKGYVFLPEKIIGEIKPDTEVTVSLHSSGNQLKAKITNREDFINPATRQVKYELTLEGEALIGALGEATFALQKEKGLLVHRGTLFGENNDQVLVVTEGKIEGRKVTVPLIQGEMAVVTSGLKEGEQVVLRGQKNLSNGQQVTTYEEK